MPPPALAGFGVCLPRPLRILGTDAAGSPAAAVFHLGGYIAKDFQDLVLIGLRHASLGLVVAMHNPILFGIARFIAAGADVA